MPSGGAQIVFLLITSFLASKLRNARVLLMILNTTVAMIGMVLVYTLKVQAGRMSGLAFSAIFAINIPIALSLITSNVSGFTKRSTVSAIMFVAYCLGNICGPQFYLTREAPRYDVCYSLYRTSSHLLTMSQLGLRSSLAGYAFGIAFLICLYIYYQYENRRRDRVYGSVAEVGSDQELADELSNKTDRTITSFRYMM